MDLTAYLNFNGTCAEAFRFYAETLPGTIEFIQTFGESPMADQTPTAYRDQIMHVRLKAGDGVLYGSDNPPGMESKAAGFAISINLSDRAEAERIFNALAEGGQVHMPLAETFWADRFGMLTDRYGTPWMVNSELRELAQK